MDPGLPSMPLFTGARVLGPRYLGICTREILDGAGPIRRLFWGIAKKNTLYNVKFTHAENVLMTHYTIFLSNFAADKPTKYLKISVAYHLCHSTDLEGKIQTLKYRFLILVVKTQ